jgi:hypothetical protein
MDRNVTIKFFRIVGAAKQTEPFINRLQHLQSIPEARRVTSLSGIPFWIDKIAA